MIVILLITLATFGLSYYVQWNLTHPARVAIKGTPADVGLTYQSVKFPSRQDKLSIQGWLIPASQAGGDKMVIETHGYRGNRSQDQPALPTAKSLHDAGFSVMMFDFRDEGESPGNTVSVGLFETRDLLGAVDYAKSLGYKHIGIIGFSMGASTALEATTRDTDVQATIADSPFASLHDYLVTNMPVWTHLPNWPFTPEILWEVKTFTGLNAVQVDPLADLKTWTPRPLLLIAGSADTTIPMRNSTLLYDEVRQNPQDSLWIVDGAKHVGAYKVNPSTYESKVTAFFTTYLK